MSNKAAGLLRSLWSVHQTTSRNYASKTYLLHEFFDNEYTFGKTELTPKFRPGRSWTLEELRLKNNSDLHKLWYVLLKERNMLLTMQGIYTRRGRAMPCPERLDKVDKSMKNLEEIVHERNDAYLKLETGDSADPPMRTITTPLGFTINKPVQEHYLPSEVTGEKEYATPYLEGDVYLMQKLWKEKEHMKGQLADYDKDWNEWRTDPETGRGLKKDYEYFKRGFRRTYNRLDHLPNSFKRKEVEA